MNYADRQQAAALLYERLQEDFSDVLPGELLVLSIPRGGVVLGKVIAERFGCVHDILVCKKIVSEKQPELALGAVCESDASLTINKRLVEDLQIKEHELQQLVDDTKTMISDRMRVFQGGKPSHLIDEKVVLLVDDGVATGETMASAVREVFTHNPHKVVVAVPVISRDALTRLKGEADAVVFLQVPSDFYAVGQWYDEFPQVSDEDVIQLLT